METTKKDIENLIQIEKDNDKLVFLTGCNGRHYHNYENMPGHARYLLVQNGSDWDILEPILNERVFSIEVL